MGEEKGVFAGKVVDNKRIAKNTYPGFFIFPLFFSMWVRGWGRERRYIGREVGALILVCEV